MSGRRWRLAVVAVGVSCAPQASTGAALPSPGCRPVEGVVAASAPWDSVTGRWRLEMVDVTGDSSGRRVIGSLALRAQDSVSQRVVRPGMTGVTVPVIGDAEIALEQVGAARIGDVSSLDAKRPGLSIWVSPASTNTVSAVMRIGEEEIQSDLVRIDGGFTALYIRQVSATAIRGGWASGVTATRASGYFCADRSAK
jgi:hypothetical protein